MKKFIAIISVVLLLLSGCSTVDTALSDQEVAMVWFRETYPDKKCDEVVIEEYTANYNGDRLVHAVFLNDGVKIASSKINADWYREYAFK